MRIAQVSPLYEAVPPRTYGGTERVVSYLTEALVRQGHEVTLFASGDSVTRAHLVASCPQGLRFDDRCTDQFAHHLVLLEQVFQRADDFDLIHFHIDYLHFPLSRRQSTPHVTTLHGRLDLPDLVAVYQEFPEPPVVSISNAQREPLPWLNWQGTVYHGLPHDLYTFRPEPGQYLAFLGRISPEKRVDRAIAIATRVGMPLKIAAKVDLTDQEYFAAEIAPELHQPLVVYVGELGEGEKDAFLGNAVPAPKVWHKHRVNMRGVPGPRCATAVSCINNIHLTLALCTPPLNALCSCPRRGSIKPGSQQPAVGSRMACAAPPHSRDIS